MAEVTDPFSSTASEYEKAFETEGVEGLQAYVIRNINAWKHVTVNIAVVGSTGSGKSSFINAIRCLKVGEDDAADVDVVESTRRVKPYPDAGNSNIVFWDLPGVGSQTFERQNYLRQINKQILSYHGKGMVDLGSFDFFLVLSCDRFTADDAWLAKEIIWDKYQKKFYFVRTKIQNSIDNDGKCRLVPRSREEILSAIDRNCKSCLGEEGLHDAQVYLIDNHETGDFDFERLKVKLIDDAPYLKAESITFSLSCKTLEHIERKKRILKNRIPKIALGSAVAAASAIPGLGISSDFSFMLEEVRFYKRTFGLTDEAVEKSADMLGVPKDELCRDLDLKSVLITFTVNDLVTVCKEIVLSEVVEEIVRTAIPIVGSLVSGVLSYRTTSACLHKVLDLIIDDAIKINKRIYTTLAEANSAYKETEIN